MALFPLWHRPKQPGSSRLPKTKPPIPRRALFEAMEQRLLLSADTVALPPTATGAAYFEQSGIFREFGEPYLQSLDLPAGSSLSVQIKPATPGYQPIVSIQSDSEPDTVLASASADSPGQAATLQGFVAPADGSYTVRVEGGFDAMVGFDLALLQNGLFEVEPQAFGANDTAALAQAIDAGFIARSADGAITATTLLGNIGQIAGDLFDEPLGDAWTVSYDPTLGYGYLMQIKPEWSDSGFLEFYGYGRLEATWQVNLGDIDDANLTFSLASSYFQQIDPLPATFDTGADGDGVAISIDGTTWHTVHQFTGNEYDAPITIDLGLVTATAGIELGSTLYVRFQTYSATDPRDYLRLEEVEILPSDGDADWYSFALAAGVPATLALSADSALAKGDATLELYSADGLLITSATLDASGQARIADFVPYLTGTYLAHVTAERSGSYTLAVVRGAALEREPDVDMFGYDAPTELKVPAVLGSFRESGFPTPSRAPEFVYMPTTRYGEGGFDWTLQPDGSVADPLFGSEELFTRGLALDGYSVDPFGSDTAFLEDETTEFVLPTIVVGDFDVSRKIRFDTDEPWVRYLEFVTNIADVTATYRVDIESTLHPELAPAALTSSGDAALDIEDVWLILGESWNQAPYFVSGFVFSDGQALDLAEADNATSQQIRYGFDLTLAPGETRAVMHFVTRGITSEEVRANVEALSQPSARHLAGMSAEEIAQVTNFDLQSLQGTPDRYVIEAAPFQTLRLVREDAVGSTAQTSPAHAVRMEVFDYDGSLLGATFDPELEILTGLAGAYEIVLTPFGTPKDYVLRIESGLRGTDPLIVAASTPTGALATSAETIDIILSHSLNPMSIDVDDLSVEGGSTVTGVEQITPNHLRFHVTTPSDEGVINYSLAGHALHDLRGIGSSAFTGSYRIDRSGPQVLSHTRDAINPARLSVINFEFNEALDPTSVSIDAIGSFTSPGGADLRATISSVGIFFDRFVQVRFAEQSEAGTYRMTIGPNVRDLLGNRMDQDADGIDGEAEDVYTATASVFSADLVVESISAPDTFTLGAPLTVQYSARNIGNQGIFRQWTDRLFLSVDDQLDANDLFLDRRAGPFSLLQGETYQSSLFGSFGSGTQMIAPDPGDYYLIVALDASQQVAELSDANNIMARPIRLQVAPTADLSVVDITPPTQITRGVPATVSWTVTNEGTAEANDWTDAVWLSRDAVLGNGDLFFGSLRTTPPLAAGGSATVSLTRTPPDTISGEYYLIVQTDAGEAYYEFRGETDNVLATAGTTRVTAPDLVVAAIDAPLTVVSDRFVRLNWTIENRGTADALGSWVDEVYLSTDAVAGADEFLGAFRHTGGLARGASVVIERDVYIQAATSGPRWIIVRTDSTNEQAEIENETNNIGIDAQPVEIVQIASPDLVVSAIEGPASVVSGEPMLLRWTVTNRGNAPAIGPWIDQTSLSSDGVIGGDTFTGDFVYTGTLGPGQSIERTQTIIPPIDFSGPYRVVIVTDAGGTIVEVAAESNNASISAAVIDVVLQPLPDLIVTSIEAPADAISGQSVPLSWSVRNAGGATATGGWIDNIYVIDEAAPETLRYLTGFSVQEDLAAGETVTRTQTVTLPLEFQGPHRFVIRTDAGQRFYERGGEANNETTDDTQMRIVRAPIPNLRVTEVIGPDGAFSSEPTTIRWTVTNDGTGATSAPLWQDHVYLSVDDTFDGFDVFLGSVPNASYLGVGERYTNMLTTTLPRNVEGIYYFIVQVDGSRSVPELEGESDNATASLQVPIELTPPPDLQVDSVSGPTSAFSGQPITLSWQVINFGAGRNKELSWTDRVYLSTDTVLDDSDALLASYSQTRLLQPQEVYLETRTGIALPVGVTGDFYFIVSTDHTNSVYEGAFESNNTGATSALTQVLLTPPPDLEVVGLNVPTTALGGDPLVFSYEVANRGATPTPNTFWVDRFYLSTDRVLDGADFLLGTAQRLGALAPDESYATQATLGIPAQWSGSYYLIAHTDAAGAVFELDNVNNVAASADPIAIEWRPPDLVVQSATSVAVTASGSVIPLEWVVANIGTGDTVLDYWLDAVFLSRNAVAGDFDDVHLGFYPHSGILEPDGSYRINASIPIAQDLEGAYHIVVQTAAPSQLPRRVPESNLANNFRVVPLSVVRAVSDLQVVGISNPASVEQGAVFGMTWSVENRGSADTRIGFWSDGVYLSLDEQLDPRTDFFINSVSRTNPLDPGEAYDVSRSFVLPSGIPLGDYYVLVHTDFGRSVFEASGEGNNVGTSAQRLRVVSPTPPGPNLQVSTVATPDVAFSSQEIELAWTVTNTGTAPTDRFWYDAIYLSRDLQLDRDTDLYLGFAYTPGHLDAGAHYDTTARFRIPGGQSGPFYALVVADGGFMQAENSESDNVGTNARLVDVRIPPPADLVAGTLTVPVDAMPGRTASLTYTVANDGTHPALGTWTDSLYLSGDETWDLDDVLVGTVTVTGSIAPGDSYTRTLTTAMPGVVSGDYRVIVRSDVRNQVVELSEANNLRASLDAVAFDVEALQLGVDATGTLGPGQFAYYRFDVGAGESVAVRLDSSGGPLTSNAVFVRYGAMPTLGEFDFTGENPLQPDQEVIVPFTAAGTYYVLVAADASFGTKPYSIRADVLPFELRRTSVPVSGNTGRVTYLVHGSRFDDATTFTMFDAANTGYDAARTRLLDASRALVTFDLTGAAPGTASLVATKAGQTTVLAEATRIEAGSRGELAYSLEAPQFIGPLAPVTIYAAYGNGGTTDIDVPLLMLAVEGALFFGRTPTVPIENNLALVLGIPDGPIDTILRPGESARIPFFVRAPLATSGGFSSTLYALDMNHVALTQARIDYDAVLAAVPGGPTQAWADYLDTLRGDFGENLRGYYDKLLRDLDMLAKGSANFSRVQYANEWVTLTPDGGTLGFRPSVPDEPEGDPDAGFAAFEPLAPASEDLAIEPAMAFAEATLQRAPLSDGGVPPADGVSQTHVVLIGIQDYQLSGSADLSGPPADVDLMHSYFRHNMGLPESNVHVLVDRPNDGRFIRPADVTRTIAGLPADADDKIVVFFSGHGADPSGNWVFGGRNNRLTPGELSAALDQVGGSRYVISDSCFSRSFVEGLSSSRTAAMAASNVLSTENHNGQFYKGRFTGHLRDGLLQGMTLQEAFDYADGKVRAETANARDPDNRADPYLENADNIDMGTPWLDPSRLREQVQRDARETHDSWMDEIQDAAGQLTRQILRNIPIIGPVMEVFSLIVASYDPNDILGPEGFAAERFVTAADPLAYTIRFENDPAATAPAQTVRITQTLDPDIDPRTFRLGDFGWGEHVFSVPANRAFFSDRIDMTASGGFFVDVVAGIDVANAEAFWQFTTIDPATGQRPANPLLGFLPPDEPNGVGDGFVSYTVRAERTAPSGTVIDAWARIIFDINEPIDTPAIFNTLDAGLPTSVIEPLAAQTNDPMISLTWSGRDDEQGSGIRDFTIFVSRDGGAFEPWLTEVTETSGVFVGARGHTYAFYSVARDNTGNRERPPALPDAAVSVAGTARITGTVFSDADVDGLRDDDETGIGAALVYIDADGDGMLDADERSTLTSPDGRYAFDGLAAGAYRIASLNPLDMLVTTPDSASHVLTVADDQTLAGADFGWFAPLAVTRITAETSGVHVRFNGRFDASVLNLYDAAVGGLGAPDVLLAGAVSGAIRGSLVLDADLQGLRFIKTGAPLAPDDYTLTLRGGADALHNLGGFRGNAGKQGELHVHTFSVRPSGAALVSLADFARGAGQSVDAPASAQGLPIHLISNGSVSEVSFVLEWDPALLSINSASLAEGLAENATLILANSPGRATFTVRSTEAFAAGKVAILSLDATVPANAPYATQHALRVSSVTIDGLQAGLGDDAVHVTSYFGDTDGSGSYSHDDVQHLRRVSVQLDSGFAAYPNADPLILGDINGNGVLSAVDVTRLLQEVNYVALVATTNRPEIPDLPDAITSKPEAMTSTSAIAAGAPTLESPAPVSETRGLLSRLAETLRHATQRVSVALEEPVAPVVTTALPTRDTVRTASPEAPRLELTPSRSVVNTQPSPGTPLVKEPGWQRDFVANGANTGRPNAALKITLPIAPAVSQAHTPAADSAVTT